MVKFMSAAQRIAAGYDQEAANAISTALERRFRNIPASEKCVDLFTKRLGLAGAAAGESAGAAAAGPTSAGPHGSHGSHTSPACAAAAAGPK